jgi:ATP/maltotriose-dependent transcriptional regulator MalT
MERGLMIELLRTKLFIPCPRKNLVARPRLVDCLTEAIAITRDQGLLSS